MNSNSQSNTPFPREHLARIYDYYANIGSAEVQYLDVNDNVQTLWGLNRDAFVGLEIPPREPLLVTGGETVLYSSSLNQVLGWRGCGKTLFALSMAGALATGGRFLDFSATRAARTIYLDGELPSSQLQERAREFTAPSENLVLVSADQLGGVINLRKDDQWEQLKLTLDLHDTEVLFLDSLSTLFRMEANEEREQLILQDRLQELRSRNLCVVTLHHLGKAGLQRGHSRNDDILDLQIQLNQPHGWEPGDGLCFELDYKKVRHGARLSQGYAVSLSDGQWLKTVSETDGAIQELLTAGKSVRAIAESLGIDRSKVFRAKKRLGKAGLDKLNGAGK